MLHSHYCLDYKQYCKSFLICRIQGRNLIGDCASDTLKELVISKSHKIEGPFVGGMLISPTKDVGCRDIGAEGIDVGVLVTELESPTKDVGCRDIGAKGIEDVGVLVTELESPTKDVGCRDIGAECAHVGSEVVAVDGAEVGAFDGGECAHVGSEVVAFEGAEVGVFDGGPTGILDGEEVGDFVGEIVGITRIGGPECFGFFGPFVGFCVGADFVC